MEKQKIYEVLKDKLLSSKVEIDEPMSKHTSFKIGGNADIYVTAKTSKDIQTTFQFAKENEIPFVVLGNGSNLLVGDKGIRGIVLKVATEEITIQKEQEYAYVIVQAGEPLAKLAHVLLKESIAGFEFAAGIPGTFGGAVVMNAGAYGGEMKQILQSVTVVNGAGEIENLDAEDLDLGYRHSNILQRGYIVAGGEIRLKPGDQALIKARMEELAAKRREKQPLEYPSAGSTFKRPEGYFAGKLIQDAGLRGFQVGGAQVSEKHCGFVINRCHATSADILELCRQIQQRVKKQSGVDLEMEVRCLGDF